MGTEYNITKAFHRKVKQMNREEMGNFLGNVLNEGYRLSIQKQLIPKEEILEVISSVPGIGKKRLEDIDKALTAYYERKGLSGPDIDITGNDTE